MVVVTKELDTEEIPIPASIFRDRSLSVLETMVEYLKEDQQLPFHRIAKLLNRNDRTIWTVYHRVKKKRNVSKWKMPSTPTSRQ